MMLSSIRLSNPVWVLRLVAVLVVCFCSVTSSGLAQTEIGFWGGLNSSPLQYINPGGIGFGGTAVHYVAPSWGLHVSIGAMMNGFYGSGYSLLPPSSGETFQALAVPVEIGARFRLREKLDDGSFFARFGISGTHFDRREIQASHITRGPETFPGITGFAVGAVFGVGFETYQMIQDRGRLFSDIAASMGILGKEDEGRRFTYLTLRVGFMLAF